MDGRAEAAMDGFTAVPYDPLPERLGYHCD
jgi:hypothetical protein